MRNKCKCTERLLVRVFAWCTINFVVKIDSVSLSMTKRVNSAFVTHSGAPLANWSQWYFDLNLIFYRFLGEAKKSTTSVSLKIVSRQHWLAWDASIGFNRQKLFHSLHNRWKIFINCFFFSIKDLNMNIEFIIDDFLAYCIY